MPCLIEHDCEIQNETHKEVYCKNSQGCKRCYKAKAKKKYL